MLFGLVCFIRVWRVLLLHHHNVVLSAVLVLLVDLSVCSRQHKTMKRLRCCVSCARKSSVVHAAVQCILIIIICGGTCRALAHVRPDAGFPLGVAVFVYALQEG